MGEALSKRYPHYACQPIFFNQKRFREDLASKSKITVFKDAIAGINQHFTTRFYEGNDVRDLVYERATFMDLILHYAWYQFDWDDDICLIAVGGYGRGELHPHSDIDILILLDNKVAKKYDDNIQNFVTQLWDIGLEIGSSVRTLKECIRIAKQDISVATNLIEARRIAGNDKLRDTLQIKTGPEHMWPVDKFFAAKLEEQADRHEKHNNTTSNLEPNIKNAPGGLRDIQMINWVAKRFYVVQTLRQLEGKDFFTEHEFGILRTGEEFLWRVRYALHLITGRAEERLLFEHQREIAEIFGYKDSDNRLAVEQFMHRYYRTVMALRELNDVLLQYLGEVINKRWLPRRKTINERFELYDNYIQVTHDKVFEETPSALLEIFVLMGKDRSVKGVRASTIRIIRESRWLVDEEFRKNPANNAIFMELFSVEYGLVTQLTRMKHYGILGRYLPEFGKITGQMQHDLFHRYTVDAHTLLVIKNIRRFSFPKEEKQFPVAAHILKKMEKPHLLLIAGLYHDIGKGRGGDHSVLGAVDAQLFCEQHGFNTRETNLVIWLVQKHLLMSYVSQKQDISDPEVIQNFALEMGDQLHLDYLYALTVADMCATNPEVWNTWRASLLRQLYMDTKRALRRGLENTIDKAELIEETQALAAARLSDKDISEETARTIWENMGDEYFVRESHLDIAWHTEAIASLKGEEKNIILVRETTSMQFEGATQIFIRVKASQHVFIAVATSLAQQNLMIQDARIYSAASGHTVDTFYVLDENGQAIGDDPHRHNAIIRAIEKELKLVGNYHNAIQRRTPRQLKHFSIPTRTSISNDLVHDHTVLEVISPDRPGLLATIGQVFLEMDIQLLNAKISTLGERVEDVFFISDMEGTPLSDPELCKTLQNTICQRLDKQVEAELNT